MKFQGKLVLITAGTNELDSASAIKFAESGANIGVIYPKGVEGKIQQLESLLLAEGVEYLTILADLSDLSDVERAVTQMVEEFGKIDIYVNTSLSLGTDQTFNEEDQSAWRSKIADNLTVTFNCCKGVGVQMLQQSFGKIINIYAFDPWEDAQSPLSSTIQQGMAGMTKNIAKELAYKNITVNTIESGLEDPKEAITSLLFLASEAADYITGQVVVVDGGLQSKARC